MLDFSIGLVLSWSTQNQSESEEIMKIKQHKTPQISRNCPYFPLLGAQTRFTEDQTRLPGAQIDFQRPKTDFQSQEVDSLSPKIDLRREIETQWRKIDS